MIKKQASFTVYAHSALSACLLINNKSEINKAADF